MTPKTAIKVRARNTPPPSRPAAPADEAARRAIDLTEVYVSTTVRTCYVYAPVVHAIRAWTAASIQTAAPTPEIGGLLFGFYTELEPAGYATHLTHFVPFRTVAAQSNSSLRVAEGMAEAYREADAEQPAPCVVGWFHTHPGHEVYLSATDLLRTHYPLFVHPYQLALVIDPLTDRWETGLFPRKEDGTMNNREDASELIYWQDLLDTFIP
jgi:proteasome lid subunit RPN8/RPN11